MQIFAQNFQNQSKEQPIPPSSQKVLTKLQNMETPADNLILVQMEAKLIIYPCQALLGLSLAVHKAE